MQKYPKVEETLAESSNDDLMGIVRNCISCDGTFAETELECYTIDELIDLFCYDRKSAENLLYAIMRGKPNLNDDYFYFDSCGDVESINEYEIPYSDYFDEMAAWLVDNAGTSDFPNWCVSDDLIEAVAEAAEMDVDEV